MPIDIPGPGIAFPAPPYAQGVTPAFVTAALAGAGNKVAWIFPRGITNHGQSFDLGSIEYVVSAVGGSGTVEVRVETVDLATGFPTGTLYQANTNGSQTVSAAGIVKQTLTAIAEVSGGTPFAIVVVNSSGNHTIAYAWNLYETKVPATAVNTGAWADATAGGAVLGLRDNGGAEVHLPQSGLFLMNAITSRAINTGTNPDEIANIFQQPFNARVCGFWWYGSAAGDYEMRLYDGAADPDVLTSVVSVDATVVSGANPGLHFLPVDGVAGLQEVFAGTNYHVAMLPTTGSSVTLYEVDLVLSERQVVWDLGNTFFALAERQNAPSNFSYSSAKRVLMGLVYDQIIGANAYGSRSRIVL